MSRERHKMMAGKLYELMAQGHIEGEFNESFIESVHLRILAGMPLTEKQGTKLEELFERY